MSGITLSNAGLLALVTDHVARLLPVAKVEEIAERAIAAQVGQLSLEQAQRHLNRPTRRALLDFCRAHRIPVRYFGRKNRFILVADIAAAQARCGVAVADGPGTRVERLAPLSVVPDEPRALGAQRRTA